MNPQPTTSSPTLTPQMMAQNFAQMKSSSPAAQANATPSTSWDAFDKATGKAQTPGYASQVTSNLGNTFTQGASNVTSDIQNREQGDNTTIGGLGRSVLGNLSAAGHVAGDIAETAGNILGSFITPLLPDSVKSAMGDATKMITDKVNAIPGMTPEIAKSLGDVFNTLTLKGGNDIAPVAGNEVSQVAKTVGEGVSNVAGKVSDTINKLNPLGEKAASLNDAIDIVSPKMSAKDTADALAQGRGQGGGLFSKTKISPDKMTSNVGEAVQDIVKKGVPASKNIANIRQALTTEAENLKTQISSVDHPYSFKELNANLKGIESPISIKGTAFEKQIGAVKNAAMNIAKKSGGTISSLLDARKGFDVLVAKEYPNLYESTSAPMKNAITSIRNTMNDFIEKNLPDNVSFKNSLNKQSMYYRAIDNIAEKAVGETKSTGIGRIGKAIKAHPVGTALTAVGADKVLKATTGLGI